MRRLTTLLLLLVFHTATTFAAPAAVGAEDRNQEFRDHVIAHVRERANQLVSATPVRESQLLTQVWSERYKHSFWYAEVAAYFDGRKIGSAAASQKSIGKTLDEAVRILFSSERMARVGAAELARTRFKVTFSYPPDQTYTVIDYQGRGFELMGTRVPVRQFSTAAMRTGIEHSRAYLLRAMDPVRHGFFKKYDARDDLPDTDLRTTYTASSLYSLIKLQQFAPDPAAEKHFRAIASFLLGMQVTRGKQAGAFHYALDTVNDQKSCRFVVGTASKTIFTLLELHQLYGGKVYLDSAKKAGDWLLTMVQPDGRVVAEARCKGKQWSRNEKQSFLYSGEVLSALSRLSLVTGARRYLVGASRIAHRVMPAAERQGYFVGDDFRAANTISTSWVVMALVDYARIDADPKVREVLQRAMHQIILRQSHNPSDVYNHGRYFDVMSTSGNGWINEVLGELHQLCKAEAFNDCAEYREAAIYTSRWLLQNSYTPINSYALKNPARAEGGFIRNYVKSSVRTDAVCHGVNGWLGLMKIVGAGEQDLLLLPERSFDETIDLLRIGRGFVSMDEN